MNKFYLCPGLKKNAGAWVFSLLLVFWPSAMTGHAALAAAEETGANPSGLWQKALDVFQKNNGLIPNKMEIFSEMLDRKGRPDSLAKYSFNIIVDDQGKTRTELTQAFKDNQDVTAEIKKKMAISEAQEKKTAGKKDSVIISMADTPFNPDRQQDVTVRANAEKQLLFDKVCQRFDFSFKTEAVRKNKKESLIWVGKAWLEENSGIPLKLEFSFEPLPKHVNRLWMIYLYESTASGDWFLQEIKAQGQGGFLFIKKGFRSSTRFSDYRRRPQKGDEK